jgi:hypothetical protein
MSQQEAEEILRLKQQVEHLKGLLADSMACERSFRLEVYRDAEFAPIIERRDRERQQRASEEYTDRLLYEIEGLDL